MRIVLCAVILTLLVYCALAQAQSASAPLTVEEKDKLLDVPLPLVRPKLSLQDALKVAERCFVSEQILGSEHYWLYRAEFMLFGDSPGWRFWWQHEVAAQGANIYIFVSMDRKCIRLRSM